MDINEFKNSVAGEIEYARKYVEQNKDKYNNTEYFPFQISDDEEPYSLTITSDEGMFYFELLANYALYGNGPCWEGLIIQILEKDMPEILDSIEFDSEADACLMYFESKRNLKKVAKHLHEICVDKSQFENYLKNIDRDRIDD